MDRAQDFVGVDDVLAQPFELRLTTTNGWAKHVTDLLAMSREGYG